MKLVILSGRSGSGKTTGLQALEDLGFYCVDNLPLGLLPTLASQLENEEHQLQRVAVGVDARNLASQLERFDSLIKQVEQLQVELSVIFLDADDSTLLKRFSATRRKHPLSNEQMSLSESIEHEARLLASIRARADLVIDTSNLDVHTLRNLIRDRVANKRETLSVLVESFAFKRGVPHDADLVFDVRVLPNPYWNPQLRQYNGKDGKVREFLFQQPESHEMLDDIFAFLVRWLPRFEKNDRSYMTIAIGCTGGQHRSVYIAEELSARLLTHGVDVQKRHLEIGG